MAARSRSSGPACVQDHGDEVTLSELEGWPVSWQDPLGKWALNADG